MSSFPAYPKLKFDGIKESSGQAVLRTPMEDGMVKQTKWRAKTLRERPLIYLLDSAADYASFKAWVDTTLNMGADWFTWTDPASATVKTARLVKGTEGVTYMPVRKVLDRWEAQFRLETYE